MGLRLLAFLVAVLVGVANADALFVTKRPEQAVEWPPPLGLIFHDDFEAQSPTWNWGDGPLTTPPGNEGTWSNWLGNSAESLSCPNPEELPPQSNGYLTYITTTNGWRGGQSLETSLRNGCLNGYAATMQYNFAADYKDIYFGIHIKFEDGYSKTMFNDAGCKVPFRVLQTGGSNIYVQYNGGRFQTTPIGVNNTAFNNLSWWLTGITPDKLYLDHDWHWMEFRIKMNSSASAQDAEVQAWIDGVAAGSITNEQFYTSPDSNFEKIWLYQGNCGNPPEEEWEQLVWKSIWFDNFTVSRNYIGPPPN